jgi:hypothetical protein
MQPADAGQSGLALSFVISLPFMKTPYSTPMMMQQGMVNSRHVRATLASS